MVLPLSLVLAVSRDTNHPPLASMRLASMSPDQIRVLKAKRKHDEWHAKHKGHEKMHAEMFLVLLLTVVLTQVRIPGCLLLGLPLAASLPISLSLYQHAHPVVLFCRNQPMPGSSVVCLIVVGACPHWSQILLMLWRKQYFESYQAVTLVGMWLVPVWFSVKLSFVSTHGCDHPGIRDQCIVRRSRPWSLHAVCPIHKTLT